MTTKTKKFSQVSRFQFRDGKNLLPKGEWEQLPVAMVRRYLEWRGHSDTRWDDEYKVTVRVPNGKTVREHTFKFEERAHAVLCQQWWMELGYTSTSLHVL